MKPPFLQTQRRVGELARFESSLVGILLEGTISDVTHIMTRLSRSCRFTSLPDPTEAHEMETDGISASLASISLLVLASSG